MQGSSSKPAALSPKRLEPEDIEWNPVSLAMDQNIRPYMIA